MMLTVAALSAASVLLVAIGAVASTVHTRRSVAKLPDAFRCKVVVNGRRLQRHGRAWPRGLCRAVWVHDSLLLVSGVLLVTVRPLLVRFAEGAVEDAPLGAVRGLGSHPVLLSLELDDAAHATLAAPRSARDVVAGPYFVALLTPNGGHGSATIEKQPPAND